MELIDLASRPGPRHLHFSAWSDRGCFLLGFVNRLRAGSSLAASASKYHFHYIIVWLRVCFTWSLNLLNTAVGVLGSYVLVCFLLPLENRQTMANRPSAQSDSTPGLGEIEAKKFLNSTAISTLSFSYPLRLLQLPSRPPLLTAHVFTVTYGGGLVAGDEVELQIKILEGAQLALLTQGSTKIYKTPSRDMRTIQGLTATVESGAGLVLLPDPIQPFRGSIYDQRQVFHIDPTSSNLLLLDWVSEGRAAIGETWALLEWRARNEVWSLPAQSDRDTPQKGKLLIRDNIRLGTASLDDDPREEMYNLGVFGTLLIKGPKLHGLGNAFLDEFSDLPRIGTNRLFAQPQPSQPGQRPKPKQSVMWTAAPVRGFVVVKFGAKEVDEVKRWLYDILLREGTVTREFGEHAMLCLR